MGVITCACNPAPVKQLCPFGLLSSQHSLLGEDEANKRHCLKNRVDSFLRITLKPGLWLPNVYTGQQASTATHRQSHTHTYTNSPTGTFSQVVISRGELLLRTGPTSEAQVSPAEQASAARRDKHIQEAVGCLAKSMGISPGPFSIM